MAIAEAKQSGVSPVEEDMAAVLLGVVKGHALLQVGPGARNSPK